MSPDDVAALAEGLGCRRRGTRTRPAWYVDNRLVYRLEDPHTLTVRCAFSLREALVERHPETFGVTPAMEKHFKVQVLLDHGNDGTVAEAIRAAVEMQCRA